MNDTLSVKRLPVLDGWRAIMLFMISWYHIWQQSWLYPSLNLGGLSVSFEPYVRTGYMMVDGILLLSAFVLFLPYARSMLCDEPLPGTFTFYIKRAARIIPSYYVYIAAMVLLLPFGTYATNLKKWTDILHFTTFSQTFFTESYLFSPIGGAVWTLAIEAQAYLIFPLLARAAVKKPKTTWAILIAAAFTYRGLVIYAMTDYAMVLNQLPAFLDVYAVGMAAAFLYVWLVLKTQNKPTWRIVFSVLSVAFLIVVLMLLREQSSENGQAAIHIGQMIRRFPIAIAFAGLFVTSALSLKALRAVTGNRIMTFLAGVTLNYYMWHPPVTQLLKRLHIPHYTQTYPNQAGEMPWQVQYTTLCFIVSFLIAVILTYAVERPIGKAIQNLGYNKRRISI